MPAVTIEAFVPSAELTEALSKPTRLQVLRVLLDANKPLSVPAIHAQTSGLRPIGIGKVLWRLRDAGLVKVHGELSSAYRFAALPHAHLKLEWLIAYMESKSAAAKP